MNIEEFIQKEGKRISIEKYDHIFHQGDYDHTLYHVESGLLKAYYLSREGKETIKSFIQAGNIIGNLSAAYKGKPCTFSLVALEDAHLITIPFRELLEAAKTSQKIALQVIEVLLSLSMKKEQREYEFLSLPAETRYNHLCEREPRLVEQLTQNDIARYLGITPVALSRIKKRLQDC